MAGHLHAAFGAAALLTSVLALAAPDAAPSAEVPPPAGQPAAVPAPAVPAPAVLLPERNACDTPSSAVATGSAQWNGWGRTLDNTRYQPEPAIRASDVAKLAVKWAYGYQSGTEFGQPTVVDGRLFLTSSSGRVYSVDAKTGCTYWTFDAPTAIRGPAVIGELARGKIVALPRKIKRTLAHLDVIKAPSAVFVAGDAGMVYALDAQKGTLLWKSQVESHPFARISAAPVINGDRVYVAVGSTEDRAALEPGYGCCTFRGSVVALDIATGRQVWKSYTVLQEPVPTRRSAAGIQEFGPAGAAILAAPTIDVPRNSVYVATNGAPNGIEQSLTDAIVAFDLDDGKLRWVKQLIRTEEAGPSGSGFSSSPVLRTLATGNQVLLAGQRSGTVYALDPDHGGAILWQTNAPGGGIGAGSAADHRCLYVATLGLLAQPANPAGVLSALDLTTGAARWKTAVPTPACAWHETSCAHGEAQAVTVMPGAALSGSLDGHIRAYSTIDGKILWDVDTAKDYATRNGVKAAGGPLDRGGPTVVNGMLYLNSGNALLAFTVDGK
ncbi:MAG TPA: PQQ-binding-like beta-propeller repeat protein [Steroidobacteraceae bacterium]|jgi:polyvinyl alcohol dehydrogenase (cytochrome)|nr:PQQ-binding-like beta-propeller repeat protein [Steroidobacteraceae bacterium]